LNNTYSLLLDHQILAEQVLM